MHLLKIACDGNFKTLLAFSKLASDKFNRKYMYEEYSICNGNWSITFACKIISFVKRFAFWLCKRNIEVVQLHKSL